MMFSITFDTTSEHINSIFFFNFCIRIRIRIRIPIRIDDDDENENSFLLQYKFTFCT